MSDEVRNQFSWLRALAHVAGIVITVFLVGIGFVFSGSASAEGAGEFAGELLLPAAILGFWWSWAVQLGRSTAKLIAIAFLAFLFLFELWVFGTAASRQRSSPLLTADEKKPPEERPLPGGVVLCQQALGLRLPVVGNTLRPANDLKQVLARQIPQDRIAQWPYRADRGEIVLLMAGRGFKNQSALENFTAGFERSAAGVKELSPPRRDLSWDGDHGEVSVYTELPENVKMQMRCITSPAGTLGCIQVIGENLEAVKPLIDGLSLNRCF